MKNIILIPILIPLFFLLIFTSQDSFSENYSLNHIENKGLICEPMKWDGVRFFIISIKNRDPIGVFSFDEEISTWSYNDLTRKTSDIIEFEALYQYPTVGGYSITFKIDRKTLSTIQGYYDNSSWLPQREYQCKMVSVSEITKKVGSLASDSNQF